MVVREGWGATPLTDNVLWRSHAGKVYYRHTLVDPTPAPAVYGAKAGVQRTLAGVHAAMIKVRPIMIDGNTDALLYAAM